MNPRTANEQSATGPAAGTRPGAGAVVVWIPGPLRALADGAEKAAIGVGGEGDADEGTVGGVLAALLERHPGLRRHLLDEDGGIRDYVNVFLNDDDIRYVGGEGANVAPGDVLTIVPSIAGG